MLAVCLLATWGTFPPYLQTYGTSVRRKLMGTFLGTLFPARAKLVTCVLVATADWGTQGFSLLE